VNVELQDDFSMDQTLSLYLLDTIPLDPRAAGLRTRAADAGRIHHGRPGHHPAQTARPGEGSEDGRDEIRRRSNTTSAWRSWTKCEYPKPNREFIYSTFNAFADKHPWVGQENIRPKSIAREMFETFRSFADYIRDYELQRAEGVLLRHLNRVYKVLKQNVPDAAKNDQVREMELYLGAMIRQVDSSLLDEWEKMRDPNYQRLAETNAGSCVPRVPRKRRWTSRAIPRRSRRRSGIASSFSCADW
jgi:hypothetical protein